MQSESFSCLNRYFKVWTEREEYSFSMVAFYAWETKIPLHSIVGTESTDFNIADVVLELLTGDIEIMRSCHKHFLEVSRNSQ